ncbi:MAG: zinc-ribbon domain-containing protein [Anaerobacillus sp.]
MTRKLRVSFQEYLPEAAGFWHPTKNGDITPNDVQPTSMRKVWWMCKICGEEWEDKVSNRHRNQILKGCPFCTNKRIGKTNSLAYNYPNLAKEWHPNKNKELTPEKVVPGSGKKVWWICEKGHEWQEYIRTRCIGSVNLNVLGCPYCSGHRLTIENSLGYKYPELISEWHPTKNNKTPYDVQPGTHEKVWWICKRGHEWKAGVHKRTSSKRNCPHCFLKTSFPEQAIYYYVKQYFINAKNRYKEYKGLNYLEIDIYIPEEDIAIEYDGVYYHKDKLEEDINKNQLIEETDLFLIRIREEGLQPLDIKNGATIYCKEGNEKALNQAIIKMFNIIKDNINHPISFDIDIKRDRIKIMEAFIHREINNSIFYTHKEAANLWHPTKNSKLSPKHFKATSTKRVWWRCEKGHEWEARIYKIASGNRCPYCSNKRVGKENCLAYTNKELIKEWHPTKNDDKTPYDFVQGSGKKVWWICEKGHEWQAIIHKRAKRGDGCGICSGKATRYTLDTLKQLFTARGCELLEKEYKSRSTKMKYKCSCGNISKITLDQFHHGELCENCKGNAR